MNVASVSTPSSVASVHISDLDDNGVNLTPTGSGGGRVDSVNTASIDVPVTSTAVSSAHRVHMFQSDALPSCTGEDVNEGSPEYQSVSGTPVSSPQSPMGAEVVTTVHISTNAVARMNSEYRPPFYGRETLAGMSARFLTHLFGCTDLPKPGTQPQTPLAQFIAYVTHRTDYPRCVLFAALVILQRLKYRFPTANKSCGHRLFISTFMIASKFLCDNSYSVKAWCEAAQGMYPVPMLKRMERDMCRFLSWDFAVDNRILADFEAYAVHNFSEDRSVYPSAPPTLVVNRLGTANHSTHPPVAPGPPADASRSTHLPLGPTLDTVDIADRDFAFGCAETHPPFRLST
ncbi:hypothetical protein NMY22_g13489 [Coprinellus aureogranulatus]|nr:hypothetical protein NMY22_g13489 [Coprinellus aureogranulatus]